MNRTFMTHQSRLALQSQRCCMIEAERDLSFLVQECRMEENGVHFFIQSDILHHGLSILFLKLCSLGVICNLLFGECSVD